MLGRSRHGFFRLLGVPTWSGSGSVWRRARLLSDNITYDAQEADVVDVIERSLDKGYRKKDEDPVRILTTKKEALSLYRDIWRKTSLFTWTDEKGVAWRDVLRASARGEFESARWEQDPEIVNRLLVVGRDAVKQVSEKFMDKHSQVRS